MTRSLEAICSFIHEKNGINDKTKLALLVAEKFSLTKDRSVYYSADYAIRFSSSASRKFSNTVLSLSNLRKYDDRPFIVCLVTVSENVCLLANTTFLKKISHSSHDLRVNNIRGSFNGSDIVREFEGIANTTDNIHRLFNIHAGIGFEGNLPRLVEATNEISPSGAKFNVKEDALANIRKAPCRAVHFVRSRDAEILKAELDYIVNKHTNEIMLAALIENTNVRGRVIEYLIAGDDEQLRQRLIAALKSQEDCIPSFKTDNALGDYQKQFESFDTETDVKTKIMILNSNPKAYNLDKMLEFLARERSVFMCYFVGVDPGKTVKTVLVSIFQKELLGATILLRHWAGRNSRGVSQFEGRVIDRLIECPSNDIDEASAVNFLQGVVDL